MSNIMKTTAEFKKDFEWQWAKEVEKWLGLPLVFNKTKTRNSN